MKTKFTMVLAVLCITSFMVGPTWAQSTETSVSTKKKRKAKRRGAKKGPGLIDRQLNKGTYGLSLGFASASFHCDCNEEPDYDRGLGFHGGVTYDKAMTRAFSLRGEGMISSRNVTSETGNTEVEMSLNYIEVGGQGMLRFATSRLMSIFVLAGPYVAALVDSSARVNGTKSKDLTEDLESFDFGFAIGAGSFFALSNSMNLMGSVQFTYRHGLSTIQEVKGSDNEVFNRALTLSGGIHF
jgi:opacity protein-like surface antigen